MTRVEYAAYQAAVNEFFEREGIVNLSTIDSEAEGYFTWSRCECCGGIAGNRYDCNGYNPTTKEVCGPYSVCTDCVYYAEYGQLDDTTMWEIEHETV